MEKPGTRNMTLGITWLIIGVVLTVGSYLLFQGAGGILFYGAILVGCIQYVIGVFQRIGYSMMSDERKAVKHAEAQVITLLRCMIMIANADGKLDDSEIDMIAAIYQRIVGAQVTRKQIQDAAKNIGHGGSNPADFVASLGTQTPIDFRFLIAKACRLVMEADGEVTKHEERVFNDVCKGLGLPPDAVDKELT